MRTTSAVIRHRRYVLPDIQVWWQSGFSLSPRFLFPPFRPAAYFMRKGPGGRSRRRPRRWRTLPRACAGSRGSRTASAPSLCSSTSSGIPCAGRRGGREGVFRVGGGRVWQVRVHNQRSRFELQNTPVPTHHLFPPLVCKRFSFCSPPVKKVIQHRPDVSTSSVPHGAPPRVCARCPWALWSTLDQTAMTIRLTNPGHGPPSSSAPAGDSQRNSPPPSGSSSSGIDPPAKLHTNQYIIF